MNESTVFISESDVVSQNETLQRTALGNALIQQVSFPFFVTLLKSICQIQYVPDQGLLEYLA